ncbi:MAG: hypothetical protein M3O32_10560 [Actinomycetota bacterium]|nr:hypothetical protein [Actinomycetota bacterium]
MFGFLQDKASWSKLPAELRQQLDGDDVIVIAEKVGIVRHLGGHVPGVFSASSVARTQGAFAVTTTRVLATLPTGADPHLRAVDTPWDVPHGPGRITISSNGVQIDISMREVDHAFNGSMTLTYKRAITDDQLGKLPATQLWCSIDPTVVYRAAGVRPRS